MRSIWVGLLSSVGCQQVTLSEQAQRGQAVYQQHCSSCHQPTGQGIPDNIPPLANSEWMSAQPTVPIRIVLHGLNGPISVAGSTYDGVMLAHKDILSDQQIADVLSYCRVAWGAQGDAISVDTVTDIRNQHADRSIPWTTQTLQQ